MHSIGVIGGGAWGTALAQVFASAGRDVLLWAREPEVVTSINNEHENTTFLKSIKLAPHLTATGDLKQIASRKILLLVTPAQHLRVTLESLKNDISKDSILVICAKGIELKTGKLLSEVCEETLPKNKVAVLTGPTFASEIARGLPCAVTIASKKQDTVKLLQEALGTKIFRPYGTKDVVGTQLGGALKNVIAIACGIVHGKGFGESARSALLTRGLAEMARLTKAMGGKEETLMGMCGIGDLVLTASSMQSRNFSFGAALGEGKTMEEILKSRNAVTEGVHTAQATLALAKARKVEMPITEAVYNCLHNGMNINDAIKDMLSRPFKGD
jgi:glycerol-3-phosphate dehydrogenase (NAD(P)+)